MLVALWLRWPGCHESLWLDELHTSWAVSTDWSDVAARAAEGNHTPAFFWLSKATCDLVGHSELSLRAWSLLAGLALPVAAYCVALRFDAGRFAASLSAWLLAIDCDSVFYAQEARPYAVLQLAALLAVWSHASAWDIAPAKSRWQWLRRAAWLAVLPQLHLTGGLIAMSIITARIVWGARAARRALVGEICLAALATVPLAPLVRAIGERRGDWDAFVPPPDLPALFWTTPGLPLFAAPLLLIGIKRMFASQSEGSTGTSRATAPADFGSRMAAPIATLATIAASGYGAAWCCSTWFGARLFYERYLIGYWALWMISGALLVSRGFVRRSRWGVAALMVGLFLAHNLTWSRVAYYGRWTLHRGEDWRAAVGWLNKHRDPNDRLYVRSGYLEADQLPQRPKDARLRAYCLGPVSGLYRVSGHSERWTPLSNRGAWSEWNGLLPMAEPGSRHWLIAHLHPDRHTAWLESLTRSDQQRVRRKRAYGAVLVAEVIRE